MARLRDSPFGVRAEGNSEEGLSLARGVAGPQELKQVGLDECDEAQGSETVQGAP